MIQLSTKYNNHIISCTALKIGNDFNISIYGGDIPHIGAVALGVPVTLPHNINKITSTASLLTVPGHKEDILAINCAKLLSKKLNTTVTICCGIHIKNIQSKDITNIITTVNNLIDDLIHKLNN